MHLPLPGLRVFEAASRHGSFAQAAEELRLTPSAVSHAIRRLEELVRTRLFARRGPHVSLTPAGETLMRHVERGFAELARGVGAVALAGPQLLRLHSALSFATQWLTPRLPSFLARHPGLQVQLATGVDFTRFNAEAFDADIIYGLPRQTGLTVVPLGEELVTPLCSPGLARQIRTAADLLSLPLIESDNKMIRWPDWFGVNGISAPPPRGARFDRSFLALAMAADGQGVALESTRLAEREIAAGRLVPPLAGRAEDCRYVGHRLVFPPAAGRHGAVASLRAWLEEELGL
jgi:LysR family transcriptional regulator, glycine cleavage system transcriptional activator